VTLNDISLQQLSEFLYEAEASGYYAQYGGEIARWQVPVWSVPGNHENFGIERDSSHVPATHPLYGRGMYHHYFGPDYYSFTRGGVHFVGLNTVDIDDQRYYGHVDSVQLAWLERDLALVPKDMPIVLSCPMSCHVLGEVGAIEPAYTPK